MRPMAIFDPSLSPLQSEDAARPPVEEDEDEELYGVAEPVSVDGEDVPITPIEEEEEAG